MSNSDTESYTQTKSIDSWMEDDMLFLREQDKIQISSIPARLTKDNPYVALCGPRVDLLNYYFEYLYAQLKSSEHYQLEVFFSVTTDSLLEFYNKRLADISVNAAKSSSDSELFRKILVISDCTGMAKNEWDLLARLLIDFPGANCGLLIICEEPFNREVEAFFKLLGSRLTRCYCNFPDARELTNFLESSSVTPYHSHNKKKLAALGITGADLEVDRAKEQSEESNTDISPKVVGEKKFNKFLFFICALILVVAIGVAYQLNNKNQAEFEATNEKTINESDVALSAEENKGELNEESVDYLLDSKIEEELNDGSLPTEEKIVGQATDLSREEDITESPVKEVNTSDLSNKVELEKQSTPIVKDVSPSTDADKAALLNNSGEIEEVNEVFILEPAANAPEDKIDNSIDIEAYYLQHAALSSQAAADTAISDVFTDFSFAFSLPQFSQTKLWHVVFSGPYATRTDAMNFAKENGVTADVVIVRGEYIVSRFPSETEDDGR